LTTGQRWTDGRPAAGPQQRLVATSLLHAASTEIAGGCIFLWVSNEASIPWPVRLSWLENTYSCPLLAGDFDL